jgi:hypothetical protein
MRLCGHTFGVVLLLRLHRRARFFCLVIFIDALLKKRNPRRRPRLLSARQPLNIIAGTYLVQREARALIIILVVRRGRCSRADNAANCVWVKCVCASLAVSLNALSPSACGLRAPECQQGQLFWCK